MAMMMTTSSIIPSTTTTTTKINTLTPRQTLIRCSLHPNKSPPSNFSGKTLTIIPTTTRQQVVVNNAKGPSGMKEQKWVHEGLIVESLPNGMFRVKLDNEDVVLGYISGRIRKSFVRVLPGDRVRIEVSRYDSTRGRITYRLRTKDLNSSG